MKPIDVAQSLDLPRHAVALVLAGGRGSRSEPSRRASRSTVAA